MKLKSVEINPALETKAITATNPYPAPEAKAITVPVWRTQRANTSITRCNGMHGDTMGTVIQ